MKILFAFFLICFLFSCWSCKKAEQFVPQDNFISFIVNNQDTINLDSSYNLSAVFNVWNSTFYSPDPVSNYTCIMSDTLKVPSVYINLPGRSVGKYNELLKNTYVRYIGSNGVTYTGILGIYEVIIKEFGNVGGQIRGEFKGVLRQKDLVGSILITNGRFSIKRLDDYPKL